MIIFVDAILLAIILLLDFVSEHIGAIATIVFAIWMFEEHEIAAFIIVSLSSLIINGLLITMITSDIHDFYERVGIIADIIIHIVFFVLFGFSLELIVSMVILYIGANIALATNTRIISIILLIATMILPIWLFVFVF